MERDFKVQKEQAEEIMMNAGFKPTSCYVTRDHKFNHVFNIRYNQFNFFLKAHTKPIYSDEQVLSGLPVSHEANAYRILKENGLLTPRVVVAESNPDNPIQYPFILTQKLEGEPVLEALKRVERREFNAILYTIGEYVRKMHDITFDQLGYGAIDGSSTSPFSTRGFDLQQRKQEALDMLEAERDQLSDAVYLGLREKFTLMDSDLLDEYNQKSFIHGALDVNKFFIKRHGNEWTITGLLDMEMAGAGDYVDDIVHFGVSIAKEFPDSFWWEPFFKGYGKEPKYQHFKLRLLGYTEDELGWKKGHRDEILSAMLAAVHWRYLFRVATYKFRKPQIADEVEE
jgi:aminoglycoside phosphotransferase